MGVKDYQRSDEESARQEAIAFLTNGVSEERFKREMMKVPTSLAPEVEAMVTRYEGDYEAVKARSLASTPGLRGKLSDLASQLARVQDENDSIRQRYLELEDAWTIMGDENTAMKKRVAILENELAEKAAALDTA